ncbi:MAG: hypothetical protein FWG36_04070 [Oscillospiraceae bacterium]|nr:hypothetical protein [Oscillospiraceae bacterium]
MNNGGTGTGSASIVLIFAVLCLTVFSIIAYSSARAGKAMTDAEVRLVKQYYDADAIAEMITAEIMLNTDDIPESVMGAEIESYLDFDTWAQIVQFNCGMNDRKELHVKLEVYPDYYNILSWRMRDIGDEDGGDFGFIFDDNLPVWDGN